MISASASNAVTFCQGNFALMTDDGQTDMAACLRAYQEIGFRGPLRPDHVPTMFGEPNDRPGYGVLGRIFALGYIRGLQHAIYGHPAALEPVR